MASHPVSFEGMYQNLARKIVTPPKPLDRVRQVFVQSGQWMARHQIREASGVAEGHLSELLNQLLRRGEIQRTGTQRKYRYASIEIEPAIPAGSGYTDQAQQVPHAKGRSK